MRVGIWNRYTGLSQKGYMLRRPDAGIGDDLLLPFNELYLEGKARGVDFITLDTADLATLDGVLFVDHSMDNDAIGQAAPLASIPKYLLTFEPPPICKENWTGHDRFDRVLTWSDTLVGSDPRYVKINFAQRDPKTVPIRPRTKFCVMIASNKIGAPGYQLRREAIDAFEYRDPPFHLYGPGWDGKKHRSYRGIVPSKRRALTEYTFSICIENAFHPGYITEKVFDCFFAGAIPIYYGDPGVANKIPADCFVDLREFMAASAVDWSRLHGRLITMPKEEARDRREAIARFLSSPEFRPFSIEAFVETILRVVTAGPTS